MKYFNLKLFKEGVFCFPPLNLYKDTRNGSLALMTVSVSASGFLNTATTFCISPLIVKVFRNFILSCLYRTEEVSHTLIPPIIDTRFHYCSVDCTHWRIKLQGDVSCFQFQEINIAKSAKPNWDQHKLYIFSNNHHAMFRCCLKISLISPATLEFPISPCCSEIVKSVLFISVCRFYLLRSKVQHSEFQLLNFNMSKELILFVYRDCS